MSSTLTTQQHNNHSYSVDENNNHALPIMPIPDVNDTCRKLLEWSAPLLTEKEREQTNEAIKYFLKEGGDGNTLQTDLIKWARTDGIANWSSSVWQDLYLESRAPLVINSNVFYYLKSKLAADTHSQAHIAAALITSVYSFIALLDTKSLSKDYQKDKPLCMAQYDNLFSSIRIPKQDTDEFKVSSCRKHIVVMHNQCVFKVQILDESLQCKSFAEIKVELENIINEAETGQNIGLLTTLDRDVWAEKRIQLLGLSTNNQAAMKAIDEAAFAVCLDAEEPEVIEDISQQLLHGNGRDRFFDKSLQFIVFKNGKTGINFEHTGVDGSVMLRLVAHMFDTINVGSDNSISPASDTASVNPNRPPSDKPQPLIFDLDESLAQVLSDSAPKFHQHVANTQTRVLSFLPFGKERIKQFRVSPDAFVQLALQLAEYRLYGKCYSAYEAVMTRTFVGGRIDVLYTVSPDSMTFIENMHSSECDIKTKQASLTHAIKTHITRANECRFGEGVYSHFLALKYRYKMAGKELGLQALPELFNDHGYLALTNSVVCTSTTSEYGVELAGYGPIVDNGYGIRYFIREDSICFNMTSRTAMKSNLESMKFHIEQSLVDMAELMSH